MADVLQRVINTIPETGKVEAEAYLNLTRVANLLASRARFAETSVALHEGRLTVDEVVANLVGPATTQKTIAMETPASTPVTGAELFGSDAPAIPAIPQADAEVMQVLSSIRSDVGKKAQPKVVAKPVQQQAQLVGSIDF